MSDQISDPTHGKKAPPHESQDAISPQGETSASNPAGEEGTGETAPRAASASLPPSDETNAAAPSDAAPPAEAATPSRSPLPLEELRAISDELAHEFPMPVEETELVLMDVDPHRIHAYWNIANAAVAAARERTGAAGPPQPLVLRFHDVTPAEAGIAQRDAPFDVEVQGLQSNAYVDLWNDGKAYMAELGMPGADGSLQRLASSNTIQLPRAGQSPAFATPEAEATAAPIAPAQKSAARAPVAPEHQSRPPGESAPPPQPKPSPAAAAVLSAAILPGARPLDPTLVAVGDEALEPVFPNVAQEALGAAAVHEEARAAESLGAGETGATGAAPGTPVAVEPVYLPPAVERAAGPTGRDETAIPPQGVPAGPESIVTYSSSSLGQDNVALEINAELHVYGRAKPGARLTIYGRTVTLRPDGSFSLRKPLPSGALVVPLLMSEGDPSGKPGGG